MRIFLAAALAVLQAAPAPLRFGTGAERLTADDVAAIDALAAGWDARPWLLWKDVSMGRPPTGEEFWYVSVQLRSWESGPLVRRGEQFRATTETEGDRVRQWQLTTGPYAWAQVRLPGREFDDVRGEDDVNRPFVTDLVVSDAELVSIVRMLRADPVFAAERSLPVSCIVRMFDDGGEYTLLTLAMGRHSTDRYRLRPAGGSWQVTWRGGVADTPSFWCRA